jgi:hypothetical protein
MSETKKVYQVLTPEGKIHDTYSNAKNAELAKNAMNKLKKTEGYKVRIMIKGKNNHGWL